MEMTYCEPQTPLFPPYVNLVNTKDHWKIGESEHNTDCDFTVGITNSYAPNICIYTLQHTPTLRYATHCTLTPTQFKLDYTYTLH